MSVELPFTAPADGEYEIEGHVYRLSQGTTVDANLLPTLDPMRGVRKNPPIAIHIQQAPPQERLVFVPFHDPRMGVRR